jgi:hypothetical protein
VKRVRDAGLKNASWVEGCELSPSVQVLLEVPKRSSRVRSAEAFESLQSPWNEACAEVLLKSC